MASNEESARKEEPVTFVLPENVEKISATTTAIEKTNVNKMEDKKTKSEQPLSITEPAVGVSGLKRKRSVRFGYQESTSSESYKIRHFLKRSKRFKEN
ncbi:hypothetical protein [Klebsiella pneumoniae]|uniref:hypothetical protein n=1 Tax=Klebsiella pneumoniae TaxID=573 RepID=UPI004055664B